VLTFFSTFKSLSIVILLLWSIFLGKLVGLLIINGEFYVIFSLEKLFGTILFVVVLFFCYYLNFSFRKFLHFYFFEINNLNWFFGGFVRKKLLRSFFLSLGEVH